MTLIKYIFPIILALMPVQAYAQECTSPEAFISSVQQWGMEPSAVTSKDLRNYIDAFNTVTGGDQDYDEFDTLFVIPLSQGKVGWAFFKDGCLTAADTVDKGLVDAIETVLGRRVGP